jgi:hypothetical protein
VLLVPQDSVAGFFAVMAICALASTRGDPHGAARSIRPTAIG